VYDAIDQCHTSQPVLFRATNANPQPAVSHAQTLKEGMQQTFSQMKKSFVIHKLVW